MRYLGTIANAGTDVLNNSTTAAPFTIPAGTTRLFLQPSAATMQAATAPNSAAFLPATTDMIQLGAANSINELPVPWSHGYTASYPAGVLVVAGPTLAVRKTDAGAGTTKVFGV